MTYLEKYKTAENYGIACAQNRLDLYHKEGIRYYVDYLGKVVDSLSIDSELLPNYLKTVKAEGLENIAYLEKIASGEITHFVYLSYFEAIKDIPIPDFLI